MTAKHSGHSGATTREYMKYSRGTAKPARTTTEHRFADRGRGGPHNIAPIGSLTRVCSRTHARLGKTLKGEAKS